MENELFQAPSTVEKVETRADNTLKLTIGVQEISSEQEAILMSLRNKLGWFLFAEKPIKEDEIDVSDFVSDFKGDKTPSVRLRAVLFVKHQQDGFKKEDFDVYYKQQIERFIDAVKDKLE